MNKILLSLVLCSERGPSIRVFELRLFLISGVMGLNLFQILITLIRPKRRNLFTTDQLVLVNLVRLALNEL